MECVDCGHRPEEAGFAAMGSVGSGVSGQQEFALRSVGTRTQSSPPQGPCHTQQTPGVRGCSAERPQALAVPHCTERASTNTCESHTPNSDRSASKDDHAVSSSDCTVSSGSQLVTNSMFMNGAGRRGGLDICGNSVVLKKKKNISQPGAHCRESRSKPENNNNAPRVQRVSNKQEQSTDGLVRPSAFKPVVPRSFHSMQNLLSAPPAGGAGGGRGEVSGGAPCVPGRQREQESPSGGTENSTGQSGLSDSGRNSLTSLPTYAGSASSCGPPHTLGPLSASTSHINKLGTAAQNGLSTSDSGRSSSSCCQRLSRPGDRPLPLQTSPPCDDIIQDLEDRLWEREQEVLHMRRNLDQSEVAIAQVFEEKQRVWEREMDDLRQNYAGRLQQVSRKALRSQHALQAQVARLQQDKRRLQDEITALLTHREELERKCLDYRKQQADILPRLEETKWEVCQKVGEISLLKQQLRESQGEVTQRAGETVALRAQLKELSAQLKEREETALSLKGSYSSKSLQLEHCEGELQRTLREVSQLRDKLGTFEAEVESLKRALDKVNRGVGRAWGGLPLTQSPTEAAPPPPSSGGDTLLSLQSDEAKAQRQWEEAGDLQRELERLQGALRLERQQREQQALSFAQERHSWLDEKQRVLQYQAQLQLSYVELLQRNQVLERQVGELGMGGASPPPISPSSPEPPTDLRSPPATSDTKPTALHQLTPTWPAASRLERIESTEI
ncbi:leucine zipper putative tumor suppressor 3-like [Brienomyrus brachyistius]|uniref:leucine zipper putative tumor suppressor 3-like n=1 Tax=Brienomyrus brachyistius TaxID=42636 RepID=UPI0020B22F32|nr:leucine zipper putative tumor suppressor 3-like [Brienomyrus brachyistius]